MKKITMFLVLAMALIIAVPAMAAPKEYIPGVKVETAVQKTATAKLKYPKVVMPEKTAVAERINGYIEQEMAAFQKDHAGEVDTKLTSSYKVRYNSNSILSVTILEEGYTNKAAHGFKTMRGMNFSTDKGALLVPADISNMEKNIKMEDTFAVKNLNAKLQAAAKAGKVHLLKDFKGITAAPADFYFDKDTRLFVIFQPYEVAPYSDGVIELDTGDSLFTIK